MREYGLENLPKLSVREKNNERRYYASGGKEFAEHQLVAIADGADPHKVFGGGQIHHVNGCRYDNRRENIVLLTSQEHGLVEHGDMEVDGEEGIIYKPLDLS
jgi:SLT domain-containing protein